MTLGGLRREHVGESKPLVDLSNFGGFAKRDPGAGGPPVPSSHTPAAMDDPYTGVVILQGSGKAPAPEPGAGSQAASRGQRHQSQGSAAVEDWHESQRGMSGRPWLMLTLILLVGVGTAAAVGLSGPSLNTDAPSGTEMDRVSVPVSPAQ